MKLYQLWLIVLKISMIVQVFLILIQKQAETSIEYLITDILFKISLGIFLILYFYINGAPRINGIDEIFVGFGGFLLIFDALYNILPKILEKYGLYFNPYTLTVSRTPFKK